MVSEEVTLLGYMQEKFSLLQKSLDDINARLVGRDKFAALCNEVSEIKVEAHEHEGRLQHVERVVWLLQIIIALMLPIVTAIVIMVVISWITGQVDISWSK